MFVRRLRDWSSGPIIIPSTSFSLSTSSSPSSSTPYSPSVLSPCSYIVKYIITVKRKRGRHTPRFNSSDSNPPSSSSTSYSRRSYQKSLLDADTSDGSSPPNQKLLCCCILCTSDRIKINSDLCVFVCAGGLMLLAGSPSTLPWSLDR